jgi:hypothetical protein
MKLWNKIAILTATVTVLPLGMAASSARPFVPPAPGGAHPVVVSDTGWEETPPASFELNTCARRIAGVSLREGPFNSLPEDPDPADNEPPSPGRQRTVTYANGDVVIDQEFGNTVRIRDDGDDTVYIYDSVYVPRSVTVPHGGTVHEVLYKTGDMFVVRTGQQVIFQQSAPLPNRPRTAGEGAAFRRAGLTDAFWMRTGVLREYLRADKSVSILEKPSQSIPLCQLLDKPYFQSDPTIVYTVVPDWNLRDR